MSETQVASNSADQNIESSDIVEPSKETISEAQQNQQANKPSSVEADLDEQKSAQPQPSQNLHNLDQHQQPSQLNQKQLDGQEAEADDAESDKERQLSQVAQELVEETLNEEIETGATQVVEASESVQDEKTIEANLDSCAIKRVKDTTVSVGTSTAPITETPEVSSTQKDDVPVRSRSSRRPSYNSNRGYVGGYQNYGLTYLPYKSNFEPSEDARRKADEFFKTLKL